MDLMERAQETIHQRCQKNGIDFQYISDSGTVEYLMEGYGYTLKQIANNRISNVHFLSAIVWI